MSHAIKKREETNCRQHGVPRSATREQRTAETREKELRDIEQYRTLVNQIQNRVRGRIWHNDSIC